MIKVSAAKRKQNQFVHKLNQIKITRIRNQLSQDSFDFSDDTCTFIINPNIFIRNNMIVLQIRVQPQAGLFKNIDFLITFLIQDLDSFLPPKLFNNRRIFHPNINPYTFEVAVPEIIDWNPSSKLSYLMRRLKYILIEPNISCIPNNPLCKKAAYLYKINRQCFRNYIMQYSPLVLEDIVLKQFQVEGMEDVMAVKYVNIRQILPCERVKQFRERSDHDDQIEVQFLNKKFATMKIETGGEVQLSWQWSLNQIQKKQNELMTCATKPIQIYQPYREEMSNIGSFGQDQMF